MRILVVEDDPLLSHHLKVQLSELGNQVQVAQTAKEGFYQATNYPIDIAIIDLGLPDQDGISLIQSLRKAELKAPILILTARVNWQDKVEGLNAGADDYLVKPFQKEELVARLDALVRRSAGFVKPQITSGPLELDLAAKQVTLDQSPMEVTAFEYQILEYLMRHCHEVVAKQRLLDVIYGDKEGDPNTIEVMVSRLRKKLTKGGLENPIATIRGQGYKFNLPCK
ncbi:response regulator [Shewanella loihica]|uniref:Two component transcriptional regulator, winged helix family n=1 Tax=Shewanella loihica (strain ATCC BAA-1088 / PV-4) TaxID=323850 RepID=A3QFG6_SHELP|nr:MULTISPECIES: response regulator [Shewanella]ABO24214.1 two component transcriptional regulator, winged helix family [Shewanella loihica PV-4]QYJ81052.1 response regulator [Shewanella aegiceratis]QYJ91488.1 response regulator [Shewanella halotolerans]QYJ96275.1 response regulator [Shewanella alkalitolerans]QYK11539.1 response regulator [Shewanella rhizosphaerae]